MSLFGQRETDGFGGWFAEEWRNRRGDALVFWVVLALYLIAFAYGR